MIMNSVLLNYENPIIRTYLDYAFVSGIVKGKRSAENYYYSNYGNICFEQSIYKNLWDSFDLFPAPRMPEWNRSGVITMEGFDTWRYENDQEDDIIDLVEKKLLENKYVYIALDDYYLIGRPNYKKSHFIHHVLITGIDLDKGHVAGVSYFMTKDSDFGLVWIPFEILKKSYKYIPRKLRGFGQESFAVWFYNYFQTIDVHGDSDFEFDLTAVIKEIEGFLNSTATDAQHFNHNKDLKKYEVSYGLEAYDIWKQFIEMADAGTINISAQPARMFYEHKTFMVAKCKFINERGYARIGEGIINQLNESVKSAFNFRMLLFEKQYKKKPDYKAIMNFMLRCRSIEEKCYSQLLETLSISAR